jgi:hypothetical protein
MQRFIYHGDLPLFFFSFSNQSKDFVVIHLQFQKTETPECKGLVLGAYHWYKAILQISLVSKNKSSIFILSPFVSLDTMK